jgi:hypothetical protein
LCWNFLVVKTASGLGSKSHPSTTSLSSLPVKEEKKMTKTEMIKKKLTKQKKQVVLAKHRDPIAEFKLFRIK